MTATDENFLARWARRKAEVAKAEGREQPPSAPPEAGKVEGAAAEIKDEAFDLASLPSLDQITADTDIRPFMNALVPADLRNAALRRMWELDTAIRDYVSPATEYAWNWNEGGNAPGYAPLESGFRAAEAAARMFSSPQGDNTLVESPAQLVNSQASPEEPPVESLLDEDVSATSAKVHVETVRLSTQNDTIPVVSENALHDASPANLTPGATPTGQLLPAPVKTAARHGRATPK
jgi:hypothetical protein